MNGFSFEGAGNLNLRQSGPLRAERAVGAAGGVRRRADRRGV